MWPQHHLKSWAPFRIDALGLITIIGAPQVNRALGTLVTHGLAEYLPLLAQQELAGDSILEPITGFHLYNLDDHIYATDIAGWFGRWLKYQKSLSWNSTCFFIDTIDNPWTMPAWQKAAGISLPILFMTGAAALAVAAEDWFGLANVGALAVSVLVRVALLSTLRAALDDGLMQVFGEKWAWSMKKILLVTPEGKAITLFAPLGLVTEAILTTPKVAHPTRYRLWRYLGWLCFGVHILTLGMSSLASQILTVCLLLTSTFIVTSWMVSKEYYVGSHIRIRRFDDLGDRESRRRAYVRLEMSPEQEQTFATWGIMPQRANATWWVEYESLKAKQDRSRFLAWKTECLASTRRPPASG
ncbi:hypothetical protein A1O3_06932 [Capronia epimyces CBS 606.96]|uniref:Uncharacterized protein n=1 Tax=Capronia epimyces CBS 606.96 TaxID=1182542 RepID=W9XK98_9EURO|nr:uncharacterized protein A1O3_06932 [Capronia epimyces CBS 606.96]EXJ80648.1 hypothetical protein A1O3_06932 [Capronia epimyces CBS 606.96]